MNVLIISHEITRIGQFQDLYTAFSFASCLLSLYPRIYTSFHVINLHLQETTKLFGKINFSTIKWIDHANSHTHRDQVNTKLFQISEYFIQQV